MNIKHDILHKLLLAFLMLSTTICVHAQNNIAEGTSGTCSWYITQTGKLVVEPVDSVSGTLDSWNYYSEYSSGYDGAPWYAYHEQILSAEIKDGVIATTCSGFFQDCKNMTEASLHGLNTENVTDMSGMFYGCSALTSLDISKLNTQHVTAMDNMFAGCTNLESLNLTNLSTIYFDEYIFEEIRIDISYMFDGCNKLTTIISNATTPSSLMVGTFAESFVNRENCTLVVPEGTKEEYAAADGWNELGKIDDGTPEIETIAEGTSGGCRWYITKAENKLVVEPAIQDGLSKPLGSWNNAAGAPWHPYCEQILSAEIKWGVMAETCTAFFKDCKNMTSIDLSGLILDFVTDMSYMFAGCSSLQNIDFSKLDFFETNKTTDMSHMFDGCSSLTTLDLSNFNTQNVTDMRGMFYGCSTLTTLNLSNFNTENVTDMSFMFDGCSSLTTLDVSNFNTQNVTDMGYMFRGCSSLTTLDVSKFNTGNVTGMSFMFSGCSGLFILDVSNFDASKCESFEGMFSNMQETKSISTPQNMQASPTEYHNFRGDYSLLELKWNSTAPITKKELTTLATSGTGILEPRSWNFTTTVETAEAIAKSIDDNFGVWAESSKGRYSVATPLTNSSIYIAEGVKLVNTIGLNFSMDTANDILFGTPAHTGVGGVVTAGGSNGYMQLGGGTPSVIIPSCNTGDEITVTAVWSTQNSSVITITNGVFTPEEGEPTNVINLTGSATDYKIVATANEDVILASKNVRYTGISISPFNPDRQDYGNMIIFVPKDYEGEDVGNTVKGGYIQELVLKNDMPMYTTQEFTAGKVSYTKEFMKQTYLEQSAGWETLMLPFEVQKVTSETRGEITPFHKGEGDKHFWLCGLTEQGFGKASRIKANIPYIIAMPNSDVYIDEYNISGNVTFSAENAIVMPTANTVPYKGKRYDIYGTYEAKEGNIFTLNQQNAYDEETLKDYYPGGAFVDNAGWVRPFEAYVIPHDGNGAKRVFPVFDDDDEDMTDMYRVYGVKVQKMPDMIYDVMGRRLAAPRKGLNIINGKKVLTK